jgi:hypothetical protein
MISTNYTKLDFTPILLNDLTSSEKVAITYLYHAKENFKEKIQIGRRKMSNIVNCCESTMTNIFNHLKENYSLEAIRQHGKEGKRIINEYKINDTYIDLSADDEKLITKIGCNTNFMMDYGLLFNYEYFGQVSPTDKVVLMALHSLKPEKYQRTKSQGLRCSVKVSIKDLQHLTKLSKETIRKSIRTLNRVGVVTTKSHKDKHNYCCRNEYFLESLQSWLNKRKKEVQQAREKQRAELEQVIETHCSDVSFAEDNTYNIFQNMEYEDDSGGNN